MNTTTKLDGKKHKGVFVIDPGANDVIAFIAAFYSEVFINKKLEAVAQTTCTGSEGISVEFPIVVLPELQLNKLHSHNAPSVPYTNGKGGFQKTDGAGSFGNNFLKRFNIILDIPKMQIFLKSNNFLHSTYYDFLAE